MIRAHILVLNYNGEDLLGETIPTLLSACSKSSYPCRLSVIDNESGDNSLAILRELFPSVEVISMPNRVLCSYNEVATRLPEEVLIFLNNDLKVDANFIDPLVRPFESRPDLFLVAPKVLDYEGTRMTGGPSTLWMSAGLVKSALNEQAAGAKEQRATFAAGSAGAYDRKKFLELRGYDPIFLPGTVEDMDLCYRAWEKGFYCLYEPRSVVYHKGQASFHERFGARGTSAVNARNIYLFMWKNFDSPRLWIEHFFFLLPRFLWSTLRGQTYWTSGFFKALGKRAEVADARDKRKLEKPSRTDVEILKLFRRSVAHGA